MREATAKSIKSHIKVECRKYGMPFTKNFYRRVKRYYNSIPRPLRATATLTLLFNKPNA